MRLVRTGRGACWFAADFDVLEFVAVVEVPCVVIDDDAEIDAAVFGALVDEFDAVDLHDVVAAVDVPFSVGHDVAVQLLTCDGLVEPFFAAGAAVGLIHCNVALVVGAVA